MRIVIQRVRRASVEVDGREVASIGAGLLALVGFAAGERPEGQFARMAERLLNLRIFDDPQGRLNRSLQDVGGELLLIPQITLTASLEKGTRPSFHTAAAPEEARHLFEAFSSATRTLHPRMAAGVFQARMVVNLENDGPVTFVLDSNHSRPPREAA